MRKRIPRVILAGTSSGCGKTTVTCALLQALSNRGEKVAAFKCGPDYIDPMFHSEIIGVPSANIDSFFFSENTLKYLLAENAAYRDISIIEGVMGYYDGIRGDGYRASTYEIAKITDSPVILVVDARGMLLSALAVMQGFLTMQADSRICGVIFNRCTAATYTYLSEQVKKQFGGSIVPLGFLPKVPSAALESRHLGLVTAAEIRDLKEKMQILARQAAETIDLAGILKLCEKAPAVSYSPIKLPQYAEKIRVAVAQDKAFCFYYRDSLAALEKMGAELIGFSPLADRELPGEIHGVYFGGGYPELYAQGLSHNISMLQSVKNALANGLPCIAECGGFMYLTEAVGQYKTVGFLSGKSFDKGKLTDFGYVTLHAKIASMLCPAGSEIPAHAFHYWDSEFTGTAFTGQKASGNIYECGIVSDHLYAGFPHFHFYANPDFAVNFYETCLKEKHRHEKIFKTNGD